MSGSSPSSALDRALVYRPWFFFVPFLLSNTLLSYFHFSLITQVWIATFGLLLPFLLAAGIILSDPARTPLNLQPERAPAEGAPIPPIAWILFAAVLLFTRFYRLTSLPFWPISDEGTFSELALGLLKKWNWTLLWGEVRFEPLLIWGLGGFFKLLSPSYLSIRLFPALISLATVLICAKAARLYLAPRAAFAFTWIFAFSFWQFSFMRLCAPEILVCLFQFAALGLLAKTLQAPADRRWPWLMGLTLVAGLGFYTYVNWGVVWLFIALVLGSRLRRSLPSFSFFLALSLALALPWAWARLHPGNLDYVHSAFSFSPFTLFSYLAGLFWRGLPSFPFGPNWGGMFDPLTGSLIFLGALFALKNLSRSALTLLGFGLALSLLPGVVTYDTELHRVTPSLPFWILLALWGVISLCPGLAKGLSRTSWPVPALLALALLGLNGFNFIFNYDDLSRVPSNRQWRSVSDAEAYGILQDLSRHTGPVYVFSQFGLGEDGVLQAACYSFDPLQDPALAQVQPQWTAVLVNGHYAPYLLRHFAGAQWRPLHNDQPVPPPPGLFLIPTASIPRTTLADWKEADRVYRRSNLDLKNKLKVEPFDRYGARFAGLDGRFPSDPFLTSVYWEKRAFYCFLDRDFPSAIRDYGIAIQKGYPAAHLYYDLGFCWKLTGNRTEAEKNFQKAVRIAGGPLVFP